LLEAGLEEHTEKTKYIAVSRHQNVRQKSQFTGS